MQQKSAYGTEQICYTHTISRIKTEQYALHCHNFYEIYYFITGDVHYLIEGHSYIPKPDSILLIPANAFHGVRVNSVTDYERYALHFLPELISPEYRKLLLSPFHAASLYRENAADYRFRQCCDFLLECSQMPECIRAAAVKCRTEALLTQLFRIYHAEEDAVLPQSGHYSIPDMIEYINCHITEDISLKTLTDSFYISKNHLNLLFKQTTGTTAANFIAFKRAALAGQLLAEGQNAAQAAVNAGFRDYSTFYRTFRRIYGCSPGKTGSLLPPA